MTQENQWNNSSQGKNLGGNYLKRTIHYIKLRFTIQEYQFVVNLTQLSNWALTPQTSLIWILFSHEPIVHALIFNTLDCWRLSNNFIPPILAIWIWSLVGACRVKRLQNLIDLTGVTLKTWKMCIRIFLLYIVVLDSNPRHFAGCWALFKILQNRSLISQGFSLIGWAWQFLNSSFCSLYVLKSWLVSIWAMSKTLLR